MMQVDIFNDTDISIMSKNIADERISVISCAPGMTSTIMGLKNKLRAKFKIMVHADWSDGTRFGMDKFNGFTSDDFDSDGFEVFVNIDQSTVQKSVESVSSVYDFLIGHINPDAVVCLAFRHDFVVNNVKSLADFPEPEFIRLGTEAKPPAVMFSARTYEGIINNVRKYVSVPLKICGNIDSKSAVSLISSIDSTRTVTTDDGNPAIKLHEPVTCILNARQFVAYVKDKDKK